MGEFNHLLVQQLGYLDENIRRKRIVVNEHLALHYEQMWRVLPSNEVLKQPQVFMASQLNLVYCAEQKVPETIYMQFMELPMGHVIEDGLLEGETHCARHIDHVAMNHQCAINTQLWKDVQKYKKAIEQFSQEFDELDLEKEFPLHQQPLSVKLLAITLERFFQNQCVVLESCENDRAWRDANICFFDSFCFLTHTENSGATLIFPSTQIPTSEQLLHVISRFYLEEYLLIDAKIGKYYFKDGLKLCFNMVSELRSDEVSIFSMSPGHLEEFDLAKIPFSIVPNTRVAIEVALRPLNKSISSPVVE